MFSTEGARPNCLSQGWRAAWPADAPLQPFSSSSLALSPSPSAIVSVSPERYKSDCGVSLLTSISSTVNSQVFMKAGSGLASYRDAKVPRFPPFLSTGKSISCLSAKDPSTSGPLHELPLPLEHFTLPVTLGVAMYLIISALVGGGRRRTRERPVLATYQV